jgi:hypothetical protein
VVLGLSQPRMRSVLCFEWHIVDVIMCVAELLRRRFEVK